MLRYTFLVDVWSVKLHQALAPVDILGSLFADADVVTFLKPRLKGVSYLTRKDIPMDDVYLRGEIDGAAKIYMTQMLVLSVTYAELIVKDYYRCLLRVHPQRMNQVLSPDGKGKATIDLNTIIEKSTKRALMANLADKAAQRASARRIDEAVARIIQDSHLAPKKPVAADLKGLIDQRNRIVHDGETGDLIWSDVHRAFGKVLYVLYVLGEAAAIHNLPISDEINFLGDFRERFERVS